MVFIKPTCEQVKAYALALIKSRRALLLKELSKVNPSTTRTSETTRILSSTPRTLEWIAGIVAGKYGPGYSEPCGEPPSLKAKPHAWATSLSEFSAERDVYISLLVQHTKAIWDALHVGRWLANDTVMQLLPEFSFSDSWSGDVIGGVSVTDETIQRHEASVRGNKLSDAVSKTYTLDQLNALLKRRVSEEVIASILEPLHACITTALSTFNNGNIPRSVYRFVHSVAFRTLWLSLGVFECCGVNVEDDTSTRIWLTVPHDKVECTSTDQIDAKDIFCGSHVSILSSLQWDFLYHAVTLARRNSASVNATQHLWCTPYVNTSSTTKSGPSPFSQDDLLTYSSVSVPKTKARARGGKVVPPPPSFSAVAKARAKAKAKAKAESDKAAAEAAAAAALSGARKKRRAQEALVEAETRRLKMAADRRRQLETRDILRRKKETKIKRLELEAKQKRLREKMDVRRRREAALEAVAKEARIKEAAAEKRRRGMLAKSGKNTTGGPPPIKPSVSGPSISTGIAPAAAAAAAAAAAENVPLPAADTIPVPPVSTVDDTDVAMTSTPLTPADIIPAPVVSIKRKYKPLVPLILHHFMPLADGLFNTKSPSGRSTSMHLLAKYVFKASDRSQREFLSSVFAYTKKNVAVELYSLLSLAHAMHYNGTISTSNESMERMTSRIDELRDGSSASRAMQLRRYFNDDARRSASGRTTLTRQRLEDLSYGQLEMLVVVTDPVVAGGRASERRNEWYRLDALIAFLSSSASSRAKSKYPPELIDAARRKWSEFTALHATGIDGAVSLDAYDGASPRPSSLPRPISFNDGAVPPFAAPIGKPAWNEAVFRYNENSCYLDSLLVILLAGEPDFYRDAFFTTDLDQVSYSRADGKVLAVCSTASSVQSELQIRAWAKTLQRSLWTDFKNLSTRNAGGGRVECGNTRNTLASCFTQMKVGGKWAQQSPDEVYKVLSDAFPILNIEFKEHIYRVDASMPGGGGWSHEQVTPAVPVYTMQDFVSSAQYAYERSIENEPPSAPAGIGTNTLFRSPQWDTMTYPVIVFVNSVSPIVLEWNKIGTEREGFYTLEKVRAFDEYILDRRYRLFGVIRHNGSRPGEERLEGHYTAYIRRGGVWYDYDDIDQRIKRAPGNVLPRDAFTHRGTTIQPYMFFYERIR